MTDQTDRQDLRIQHLEMRVEKLEARRTGRLDHLFPPGAIAWLRHGERGTSSEAIWSHLTGVPIGRGMWPPADAGDLRRCRALLADVPEFAARLHEMAEVSPSWARLVDRWDDVCATMDAELRSGDGGGCPKTYALMQAVLDGKGQWR